MSAENVALVRSLHPGPTFDLAPLINDEQASQSWRELLEHLFDPAVEGTMRLPGEMTVSYSTLDGLRNAWRTWMRRWDSYYDEIEDVLDEGERIVVLHHYRARRTDEPELTCRTASVWRVRDGCIGRVDFNLPRAEALGERGSGG